MKVAVLTGYDKNGHMLEIRDIPINRCGNYSISR